MPCTLAVLFFFFKPLRKSDIPVARSARRAHTSPAHQPAKRLFAAAEKQTDKQTYLLAHLCTQHAWLVHSGCVERTGRRTLAPNTAGDALLMVTETRLHRARLISHPWN